MEKPVRILLIGGNGFIGRFVVTTLQQQGHALALFHRGTAPAPEGVEQIRGNRQQLGDSSQQLRAFAADVVIDFVTSSHRQARDLMDVFRGATQRLILLSSMDVYRAIGIFHGTETGPLQEVPLTEESELRGSLPPYTRETLESLRKVFPWVTDDYDKIPAERVVMNGELPATVLRLPMTYGPGDRLHRFYPVVKRIADQRRQLIFPQTLAAWRSPRGYVENVAAAISLAATDERSAGRIYNVCEQPPFSELEWARKIGAAMQWTGQFVVLPDDQAPPDLRRPGNAAQHWTASSERIRRELGYSEPVPLDQAIRRTIEWERNHPPSKEFMPKIDYQAEDAALAKG
jgi:nucleoside-diphosphate-sugar epimerase